VELKYKLLNEVSDLFIAFNRTIVELKSF